MLALTHTTDELYKTKEPAICVCGTATTVGIDGLSNTKIKVFLKCVVQNDACEQLETRLMYKSGGQEYDEFWDERNLLAFGIKDGLVVGRENNIVILSRRETLND